MARKKAQRLPSGKWRVQVIESKEWDEENQKWKYHRTSLIADTENEVYMLEAEWNLTHTKNKKLANPVLKDAITAYVKKNEGILSRSTLSAYESARDHSFHDLMNMRIRSITDDVMNEAIQKEYKRRKERGGALISPKTVKNNYGLIASVCREYKIIWDVKLKPWKPPVHELSTPEIVYRAFKGSEIELPVLLAMWMTLSMSEIRGLTKSGSVKGNMLYVDQVKVYVNGEDVTKPVAKNTTRNRGIIIPPYIMNLINQVEGDYFTELSVFQIEHRFRMGIREAGLPKMTFHDLRHVAASTMEMLGVPDKYKQERGGWKTDSIMRSTYVQTFNPVRREYDKLIDSFFERIVNDP